MRRAPEPADVAAIVTYAAIALFLVFAWMAARPVQP